MKNTKHILGLMALVCCNQPVVKAEYNPGILAVCEESLSKEEIEIALKKKPEYFWKELEVLQELDGSGEISEIKNEALDWGSKNITDPKLRKQFEDNINTYASRAANPDNLEEEYFYFPKTIEEKIKQLGNKVNEVIENSNGSLNKEDKEHIAAHCKVFSFWCLDNIHDAELLYKIQSCVVMNLLMSGCLEG